MKAFREIVLFVLLLAVLFAIFATIAGAQDKPAATPTQLTPDQVKEIGEAALMIQAARQQRTEIETELQRWAAKYGQLIQEYRKLHGAADDCTLNARQEWQCPEKKAEEAKK